MGSSTTMPLRSRVFIEGSGGSLDPAGLTTLIPATCNAFTQDTCQAQRAHMRCLIVDDNRVFLEAARVLLEREGLTVVGVARSGREALEQAQALQPDLVLVDVALGDESGFEVARSLVNDGRAGALAVIMTSTRAEVDLGSVVADSCVHGFLPKSELSAQAIRRVLGSAPG